MYFLLSIIRRIGDVKMIDVYNIGECFVKGFREMLFVQSLLDDVSVHIEIVENGKINVSLLQPSIKGDYTVRGI